MEEDNYLINITVNHRKAGLNSIKGFLATSEDEEYNASIPRHLDSTVAWICWDQMIDNILRTSDNDVELAIKVTQREYKLRMGKTIMYMRKYANDEDVSDFVEQVDNFIRLKLQDRAR